MSPSERAARHQQEQHSLNPLKGIAKLGLWVIGILGTGLFFRNKDRVGEWIDSGQWPHASIYIVCGIVGVGIICYLLSSPAWLQPAQVTILPSYEDSSEPSKPTATTENIASDYQFTHEHFDALVAKSRQAWLEGKLAHVSDGFKKWAESNSMDKFIKPEKNAIAFAFIHAPPEDDEYLISADDAGVRLSFVLTNRYFYFFGLAPDAHFTAYETGKVPVSSIKSCTWKKGWVFIQATLTLKSGRTLHLKDLMEEDALVYLDKICGSGTHAA